MRLAVPLVVATLAIALATIEGCGSAEAEEPARFTPGADAGGDGTDPASGGATGEGGANDCRSAGTVTALGACLDAGTAPRACLAKVRAAGDPACDDDGDGLDDALEDALLHAYAPVFAFNEANGDHSGGDSESRFPANLAHFAKSSTLYWRVDGDDRTKKVVDEAPTLDTLKDGRFTEGGTERRADVTALGQGPNFWLCLNDASDAVVVSSETASRTLGGGVDVLSVAHPTGKDPGGRYVVLTYMLFYVENRFTLDNHEGDFEGGAVFVDLDTGAVPAVFTDRHPTADTTTVIPSDPARDPATGSPHYNVCSDASGGDTGVRFWDIAGPRHHPVFYTSGGSHASYGYPGATKIQGLACTEASIIRDVHNGNGPKLVVHEGGYAVSFDPRSPTAPVQEGVHIVNLGERRKLRAAWSAFAGQWGCTLATIPKSYPGPWDNARLCRHWLTNDWGTAPPFARSTATACSDE